jgi:excisionase family DNA binding protein
MLLTISDVAEELAVSQATVRRLVLGGKLKYVRVGKLMRFNPDDLCQYIKEATTTTSACKSMGKDIPTPAKVLPMSRQRLSKQKLDKILSMSHSAKLATR